MRVIGRGIVILLEPGFPALFVVSTRLGETNQPGEVRQKRAEFAARAGVFKVDFGRDMRAKRLALHVSVR